ncbi:transcriptional regulator, AraC family [Duganella sp. CF517]|uniref:AraC family transcriptional regulator n=1 Tax=Duganella sp. CF517 TaxID=1881038 RepID=UPI0008CCEF57|nr:AraC family transcriptional regulator [Duganella sp. CF517]SEO17525.1 transcriptional regulator, AraC family [Duganella sp. CF517]
MRDGRNIYRYRPNLMDPLSDFLMLMRPCDYGFRGLDAAGNWALAFTASDGVLCFAIETGGCWLRLADAAAPTRLEAGDVVLLTGGGAVHLYSGETAESRDAQAFLSQVPPGEVATLNGGGECRGIGGYFGLEGTDGRGLLDAIPPVVHVQSATSKTALYSGVKRLMSELRDPRPGSELIASHLAQALLVEALRAHLENATASQGWLAALSVPTLRRALTAMHADVARRWTLQDLAAVAGMSRSSFAARFEQVTGQTPIAYLTRWRMFLAADRLAKSGRSLADVAASVGYESESAFGSAFKRVMNFSPRQYRTRSSTQ